MATLSPEVLGLLLQEHLLLLRHGRRQRPRPHADVELQGRGGAGGLQQPQVGQKGLADGLRELAEAAGVQTGEAQQAATERSLGLLAHVESFKRV